MDVPTSGSKKKLGEVETVETKLTWRINKISEYCQLSDIESPVFKTKSDDGENSWKLLLSTDDDICENSENDNTHFEIYLKSLNPKVVRATVKFYVLVDKFFDEFGHKNLDGQEFQPQASWGYGNFIDRQLLSEKFNKYCWNDCLTIGCTITTGNFIQLQALKDKIEEEEQQKLLCLEMVANLFNESKFSDIVFVIEGQTIYAHQCILSKRSPVFEAMFTHGMPKTKNNRVEISDISYIAMHDTILYLYTGSVPMILSYTTSGILVKYFMDVLIAAEKYRIDYLKEKCEEKLSDFLKVDNIFEYLNFADMHNASHLKEKAIEFIVDYGKDIIELSSFKKYCSKLNGDLVSEVFEALVIKKRRIE